MVVRNLLQARECQMTLTVLEPEGLYPTTELEQRIMGPGVRILQGPCKTSLAELPDELCQQAEGLMTLRMAVPADQIARFPKLKVVIRMGVGYDRVDRAACAARVDAAVRWSPVGSSAPEAPWPRGRARPGPPRWR